MRNVTMIPARQTTITAKNARLIRRMAMLVRPSPRRRLVAVVLNRRGADEVLPVSALHAPSVLLVRSGRTTMKSSSGTGCGYTLDSTTTR
ncbi:Hypp4636 [Branchiostoma lanceolatum]|uniref:Hypp4636 protein n=1 Tax=Branchiostoma lanceolatum TaxID=7740 RepID=A0A8K0F1N8_BRALA|nr:Hypp4636 [Branchiostoma lanceolatum]